VIDHVPKDVCAVKSLQTLFLRTTPVREWGLGVEDKLHVRVILSSEHARDLRRLGRLAPG
jgi:hypothetical protein